MYGKIMIFVLRNENIRKMYIFKKFLKLGKILKKNIEKDTSPKHLNSK